MFQGELTFYVIDDYSASKAMTKKKDMLSKMAFSGCHVEQSVWVLTRKYNSILKGLREQTRWVVLFHCKDCDYLDEYLWENEVMPPEEQGIVQQQLAQTRHAKLLLKAELLIKSHHE